MAVVKAQAFSAHNQEQTLVLPHASWITQEQQLNFSEFLLFVVTILQGSYKKLNEF